MGVQRAGWNGVGERRGYIARRVGAKEPNSYHTIEVLAPVVQRVDNSIHFISYCLVNSEVRLLRLIYWIEINR